MSLHVFAWLGVTSVSLDTAQGDCVVPCPQIPGSPRPVSWFESQFVELVGKLDLEVVPLLFAIPVTIQQLAVTLHQYHPVPIVLSQNGENEPLTIGFERLPSDA